MSAYTVNPPFWVTKCGECLHYSIKWCKCRFTNEPVRYDDEICDYQKEQNIFFREALEAERRKVENEQ